MRNLMVNASGTLEGLPPNEHIAMEAILFNFQLGGFARGFRTGFS